MNLLTLLLLFINELNFILLGIELITLYFGCTSIYCFLEGNCMLKVLIIFSFNFFVHLFSFFVLKGYFPEEVHIVKKYKKKLSNHIEI